MTLVENESIVPDDNEVANIFNKYFSNLVDGLNLHVPENLVNHYCKGEDLFSSAILNKFSFKTASISDIKKELQNLDTSKATQESGLPTRVIKENFDILAPFPLVLLTAPSICRIL